MSGLARRRLRQLGAAALAIFSLSTLLASCGGAGPLHVSVPEPSGAAASQCAALVSGARARVDGQPRRDLSPATRFAAAWGDPAIVLSCGGAAPSALRPTSRCFVINGVGWLVTHAGKEVDPEGPVTGSLDFTTIGRTPYVAIHVPDKYQPGADPVIDLTATVKAHTTVRRTCS